MFNFTKYSSYALVLFTIITSGSLYYTAYNDDALLILYLLLALIVNYQYKRLYISKYYALYIVTILIFMLLHSTFSNENPNYASYIGFFIKIVASILVVTAIGANRYIKYYVNIIVSLAVLNIIIYYDQVYLVGYSSTLSDILPQLKSDSNFFYKNYIFYFDVINGIQGINIRNSGIFWEPGAYQYFLNMALLFNIYQEEGKYLSKKNIVLAISIISTHSTTGYLLFALIMMMIIFFNFKRAIISKFLVGIMLITIIISSVIIEKFKMYDGEIASRSTQRRVLDTIIDIEILHNNPAFGIGLSDREEYLVYSDLYFGGTSSSNSITFILARIGLLGFLFIYFPLIGRAKIRRYGGMTIVITVLSLFAENMIMMPVVLCTFIVLNENAINRGFKNIL